MTHVLLMLCGHVQDKDLHMSHSLKELYLNFFFPYESTYPQECISACIGDHGSHGAYVSYAKRTLSPGGTLCCARLGLALMVELVLLKVRTTTSASHLLQTCTLVFCLWLEWRFFSRWRLVALGWVTYSIVRPHISIHEFLQMLPIHLTFRTA